MTSEWLSMCISNDRPERLKLFVLNSTCLNQATFDVHAFSSWKWPRATVRKPRLGCAFWLPTFRILFLHDCLILKLHRKWLGLSKNQKPKDQPKKKLDKEQRQRLQRLSEAQVGPKDTVGWGLRGLDPKKWSDSHDGRNVFGNVGKRWFFENVKVAQKQLVRIIHWRSFRLQELQCVDLTNTHGYPMKSP